MHSYYHPFYGAELYHTKLYSTTPYQKTPPPCPLFCSWSVLFWLWTKLLSVMERFYFFMERFPFGHGGEVNPDTGQVEPSCWGERQSQQVRTAFRASLGIRRFGIEAIHRQDEAFHLPWHTVRRSVAPDFAASFLENKAATHECVV